MVQFLSIFFFLGFLQFLLGFSKVPVFFGHSILRNAPSWFCLQDYTRMCGQRNLKSYSVNSLVPQFIELVETQNPSHQSASLSTAPNVKLKPSFLSAVAVLRAKSYRRWQQTSFRLRLKSDGTRAETRFRLSAKRTSPFKSAGGREFSLITGSCGTRFSGSNAGYIMFRGSVKSTGYPLHSPVSPSLPLPFVTVCHHFSTVLYQTESMLPALNSHVLSLDITTGISMCLNLLGLSAQYCSNRIKFKALKSRSRE